MGIFWSRTVFLFFYVALNKKSTCHRKFPPTKSVQIGQSTGLKPVWGCVAYCVPGCMAGCVPGCIIVFVAVYVSCSVAGSVSGCVAFYVAGLLCCLLCACFLAALSSSRGLVVGWLVRWSVGRSVMFVKKWPLEYMSGNSRGVKRPYLGHTIILCNTLLLAPEPILMALDSFYLTNTSSRVILYHICQMIADNKA